MNISRLKKIENNAYVKKRYKMYKSKKRWVFASILFFGLLGCSLIEGKVVSASEIEPPTIELTDQFQNGSHLESKSDADKVWLIETKNSSTEVTSYTPNREDYTLNDTQSKRMNQNLENTSKENDGTVNKSNETNQELVDSQKEEKVAIVKNKMPKVIFHEERVEPEQLKEDISTSSDTFEKDTLPDQSNEKTDAEAKNVGEIKSLIVEENSESLKNNSIIESDIQSIRMPKQDLINSEIPHRTVVELDNNDESETERNLKRGKRDNLIKIGINDSSTIDVNKKKNSNGEDGSQQNPYSANANIVLILNQAKTIDGGVIGGSSKYIAIDIPETHQGAISFTKGEKIKVTSTNFPNPGDVIPGLTSVVNTVQALINAAGTASTYVLDSNINEVVSELDNLKRLITHTSEVDVPVLSYRVVGNKLEVEISSDGIAKTLGDNINKAIIDLSNAVGNFSFKSESLFGSAAAATANGPIYLPKKTAEAVLNGIGNAASIAGNLGNYVDSGNFFGHIKAELPITVNQEKVIANGKGYAIPVEFRGVITNESPINLVFETNKNNIVKPATIYFKGQKPIISWVPSTQLIIVTEGSNFDLYQGITNLPDGLSISVTDKNTKLNQLKSRTELYSIPVKVSGPGINKDVTLQVKVIPDYKKWESQVIPVEVDKDGEPDLLGGITNVPDGTKTEVTKEIDPSKPGEQTGQVTVTFPDGSKKVVDVPVTVKEPEADKFTPEIIPVEVDKDGEPDLLGGITNVPDGAKTEVTKEIDPSKPGEQTGQVTVTFPDGSKKVVDVPVTVKEPEADKFTPEIIPVEVDKDGEPDLLGGITNVPDGAKTEVTKEIDPSKPGEQTGQVTVTFPDGSKKVVDVPVTVDWTIPSLILLKGELLDLSDASLYNGPSDGKVEIIRGADTNTPGTHYVEVKVRPGRYHYFPILVVEVQPAEILRGSTINILDLITGVDDDKKAVVQMIDSNKIGKQSGKVIVANLNYSTTRVIDVPVTVKESEADKFEPKVAPVVVNKGENPDLPGAIGNTPDGAKTEVTRQVDFNKPGEQTGQVTVTFPDGSKKVIDVPVTVKEPTEVDGSSQTETPEKIDGSSQTETPEKIDGSSQTETPEKIDGSSQTETPDKVDGSSQTETPEKIDGSSQTETPEKIDGGSQTEAPDKVDGGSQTETPDKVDGSSQTETPDKVDGGSQTEAPDKVDGGSQIEISFKENDKFLQDIKELNSSNQMVKLAKKLPKTGEEDHEFTNNLLGAIAVSIAGIGLAKMRKSEEEK